MILLHNTKASSKEIWGENDWVEKQPQSKLGMEVMRQNSGVTQLSWSQKNIHPESLTSHEDLLPCVPIIPVSLTDER